MPAALGWSVHSGWAVVVGVAAGGAAPSVVLRRRVDLVTPDLPRMLYHAAQELSLEDASQLIARVEASVAVTAAAAVGEVVDDLRGRAGEEVAAAVLGRPVDVPPLEQVLASHARLHTAEGVLYREAVEDACLSLGVATSYVEPKTVIPEAEAALGWSSGDAVGWLAATGKSLGPPWQKDHKDAALAAVVVLAAG